MLKPELLVKWASSTNSQFPISSDALSRWGVDSSEIHDSTARACCSFMFEHQIPILAEELMRTGHLGSLTSLFHKHGVNIRHLALVGMICFKPSVRLVIAEEIVIRVINCLTRGFLREQYNLSLIIEWSFLLENWENRQLPSYDGV
jgi:hypothetical protein